MKKAQKIGAEIPARITTPKEFMMDQKLYPFDYIIDLLKNPY